MPPTPNRPSTSLAHRRAGAGAVAAGSDLDPGGTSSTVDLPFEADSERPWADWQHVPRQVLDALSHSGCLPEPFFAGSASEAKVRRRGTHYLERASAWAVGPTLIAVVDATRPLEQVETGRFRPSGGWQLQVRRQLVIDEPKRRTGTVPADVLPPDVPGTVDPDTDTSPSGFIDLLPAVVRKQIIGTVPAPDIEEEYLWRITNRGKPYRHEAGHLRIGSGHVIATLAEREISVGRLQSARSAERDLDLAPWTITTLTAGIGRQETLEIDATAARTALPGDPRTARRQIG